MSNDHGLAERFWEKVDVRSPSQCWNWQGAIDHDGYGRISVSRKNRKAPRIAWQLTRDKTLKRNQHVCHTCDNPACVNPAHLWVGSHSENMLDSVKKKRHVQARKTHCKNGHPLSGRNLYVKPSGARICITCRRLREQKYRVANEK